MTIRITQGDTYAPINTTVLKNGLPFDCTGATANFYITHTVSENVYREPCTVNVSTLTFTFTPSSTSESGVFHGIYIAIFPDGTSISMPNEGYIDVIIKKSVPPMGAFGEIYSLEFMKTATYDSDNDGIVDFAEKLSNGGRGKSYNEIHGELTTHTAIANAHHSNLNDPTSPEKAALDASISPSATNRFITHSDLMLNNILANDIVVDIEGTLSTNISIAPKLITRSQFISGIKGYLLSLPTGRPVIIDIIKNNPAILTNSIFVTPPSILTSLTQTNGVFQFDFSSVLNPDKLSLNINDVLYVKITQVGSGTAGSGLNLNIMF